MVVEGKDEEEEDEVVEVGVVVVAVVDVVDEAVVGEERAIKISNKHNLRHLLPEEAVVVVVDVEVEVEIIEVIVIVDQQHQKVDQRHQNQNYKMVKRVLMYIQYLKMNVLSLLRY